MKTSSHTEAVKEIYAALNRNDMPTIFQHFDPQIVRVEFEGLPSGATYRGQEEVQAHFAKGRDTWAEGACEPERFFVAGDKVVVFVHVRVRLMDKVEWNEGRIADVFTFRNGLVTQMRSFLERQEALEWSGVAAKNKDPLEGVTLEKMLTALVAEYGWEGLGDRIRVNCFLNDPSIKSSLTFLRRTPWARAKVEQLYLRMAGE